MPNSGLYKVDGLLSSNPSLADANGNTISFSFTVPSVGDATGLTVMTDEQKADVRALMAYVGNVTGISFQEASGIMSSKAIHFAVGDIGSFAAVTEYNGGTSFDIVVDTITYPSNVSFAPGGSAWHLLLHEMGHVLGLDHPNLPAGENSTRNTVMSYNYSGGFATTFQPYDLPPRQNSCRLHRPTPGAAMKDRLGSIRTGIHG